MKIAVVGLGKLGCPMAALWAKRGHNVIGVDIYENIVEAVNEGESPIYETGMEELMAEVGGNYLRATLDLEEAAATANVIFVVTATPSKPDGWFSLEYVLPPMEAIGRVIANRSDFPIVVLTSTVMPGSMENEIKPALEKASGKTCGLEFGLCYNPEFIALGSVLHDMENPDLVLIGASDARSANTLANMYTRDSPASPRLCRNQPSVVKTNFVNAELAKLAINRYLTLKIEYANSLAWICGALPGSDVAEVTRAVGCDSRIGRKYLRAGLCPGGPCLPRDVRAMEALYRSLEKSGRGKIADALWARILDCLDQGPQVIGFLGLSYKPETNVIEESPAIALIKQVGHAAAAVLAYDPKADSVEKILPLVTRSWNMQDCVKASDVIVIATAWEEFSSLNLSMFDLNRGRPVVFDPWRVVDRERFCGRVDYYTIGEGPKE